MSIKTVCTLDYGIEPDTGEDCAAALQALFDGLAYESGTEFCVQFKKGNYHIHLPIRIRGAKYMKNFPSPDSSTSAQQTALTKKARRTMRWPPIIWTSSVCRSPRPTDAERRAL